jgi:SAM-dependent methyltransferase
MSEIKEAVRSHYANIARQLAVLPAESAVGCCSGDDSCGCDCGYSADELNAVGLGEGISQGCGNPTMLADLHPGEIVLDLGSGAGLDVLLSAKRVSPGGHAYGVDMTDEMLELANRNRDRSRLKNATFLKGSIDNVPLPSGSVDVVISNCVINLAEDKAAVIKEAFRVLRSGGRFAVADMVEIEPLGAEAKTKLDSWAGCVAGTIPIEDYRAALLDAGFAEPEFEVHSVESLDGVGKVGSAYIRALKR